MKQFFLLVALVLSTTAFSQVGIGTTDPKATLDVVGETTNTAKFDGVIAPRIKKSELGAKTYTADQEGAIIYVNEIDFSSSAQVANVNAIGYYYFNASSNWASITTEAHAIGDVKTGLQTTDHNGWIKLDGRAKTTLTTTQQAQATALGIGTNLPNATNSVLMQNGQALGSITGSNTKTIAQNQLPNVSPTITVTVASAGTPSGTVTVANTTSTMQSAGAHTHSAVISTVTPDGWPNYGNLSRTDNWNDFGTGSSPDTYGPHNLNVNSAGAHTHTMNDHGHTATFAGSTLTAHGHSATSSSINGGLTQQPLDITPQSLSVNTFIYLGN